MPWWRVWCRRRIPVFHGDDAGKLGLGGWVRNCYDGSVEVEAQGERGKVARLISALKQGPRYADVERVDVTEIPLQELKPARHGFPSFGVFYER